MKADQILPTVKSRKALAKLIMDCTKEVDIHNVIVRMTQEGVFNHPNLHDWLQNCIRDIYNHPDYCDRILSFGLRFDVFNILIRKALAKYFDRLPGGGELRRAAMMGFNLGA